MYRLICCFAYRIFHIIKYNLFILPYPVNGHLGPSDPSTCRPVDPSTHPRFILNCNLFYHSLPSEPSPWRSLTRQPVDLSNKKHAIPFPLYTYIPKYHNYPATCRPVDPSTCRPVNLSTKPETITILK